VGLRKVRGAAKRDPDPERGKAEIRPARRRKSNGREEKLIRRGGK